MNDSVGCDRSRLTRRANLRAFLRDDIPRRVILLGTCAKRRQRICVSTHTVGAYVKGDLDFPSSLIRARIGPGRLLLVPRAPAARRAGLKSPSVSLRKIFDAPPILSGSLPNGSIRRTDRRRPSRSFRVHFSSKKICHDGTKVSPWKSAMMARKEC